MAKTKHDQIAERIAHKERTSYNKGRGPDIKTSSRVIEVATHDLKGSIRHLRGFQKPSYLATSSDMVKTAMDLTKGTKVGVMGPTGTIRKRATGGGRGR